MAGEYANEVRIGGPEPGQGNVIAGHVSTGVLMEGSPGLPPVGGIRVAGNSIYGNGEIGIDLMPNTWDFGHTPNDPLDADSGANWLQNHPEIVQATRTGQTIAVVGQLHSEPGNLYTVELFATPACDASGFGQGQLFVGSTSVSTDLGGNGIFEVTMTADVADGWYLTSTATLEPVGATSEFSACLPIESSAVVLGDVNLDGFVTLMDIVPFVEHLNSGTFQAEADVNQDGAVSLSDVVPFIDILTGN